MRKRFLLTCLVGWSLMGSAVYADVGLAGVDGNGSLKSPVPSTDVEGHETTAAPSPKKKKHKHHKAPSTTPSSVPVTPSAQ